MNRLLVAVIISIALITAAHADDVISVAASAKGTLLDQAGVAIAKVATNNGDHRSTVRDYTSASVFSPAIACGQADFGVANHYEMMLAVTGQTYFEGRRQDNLRVVTALFPLPIAIFVRQDSPYQRIADL